MANAQRQPMSWVSVDPDAAHDHVEYTGLVVPGAMTSSTPKKDHPSTFFECHLLRRVECRQVPAGSWVLEVCRVE